VAFAAGTLAGALSAWIGSAILGPLVGWDLAALILIGWSWLGEWHLGPSETARHALRVNPGRATSDLLLLAASVASVGAVAVLIAEEHSYAGRVTAGAVGLASVGLSWTLVHVVYAARYATIYYSTNRGIDFNETEAPRYLDFLYVAFTIGMTYQVSDTPLSNSTIRAAALGHALLSYVLGAVVLAASINLVIGLTGIR
jgi:uncharacterized membrane protein